VFPDGTAHEAPIMETEPGRRLRIGYYGGSVATFELGSDGSGGCELTLTDEGVPATTEPTDGRAIRKAHREARLESNLLNAGSPPSEGVATRGAGQDREPR